MANSILERLGGKLVLDQVIEYFYARVLLDLNIRPYFEHIEMKRLKKHQTEFIGSLLSKETIYTGRNLAQAHAGLNITEQHYMKVASYLEEALENAKAPKDITKYLLEVVYSVKKDIINK